MRNLAKLLVTIAIIASVTVPVAACINDRDTYSNEKQFKSLYPDPMPTTPDQPFGNRQQLLVYGASGLGVGLMAAAGFFGLYRRPTRNSEP